MSIKLRELIRTVRACKTAADERAVIAKECALIRTAFKEEDSSYRHRNVAKLLFIHMLGYPSHFGQMECLKLIASPRFPEKRIGYLGLCLLVEETSEVLTLVTNSLSLDLNHHNHDVVGIALAALGNISNTEMMRDLATTVHKMLSHSNPNIQKKAALTAGRIFKKVPDVVEDFVDKLCSLIANKNHSVMLTSITVLIDVAENHPSFRKKIRKSVPTLDKILKNLVLSGYLPEHDVSGITDPFLQVKILHLLRLLGRDHEGASEQMSDILAQVATNTESSKNPGNAILYECVKTIMAIESESGLRVLAINILGRFLGNRDNNIRYVALHTLGSVVSIDTEAVQRHRQTIVDCLKDPDVSIRSRALELIYQLMNTETVSFLTKELLNYLAVAPVYQKNELCSHMTDVIERFAPSKRWHIDTLISMLSIAGNEAPESVWQTLITLIGQASDCREYVVHKMYAALKEDMSQLGLVHVAVWAIGEYGEALKTPPPEDSGNKFGAMDDMAIIELLEQVQKLHNATVVTKGMLMNAYLKLVERLKSDPAQKRLVKLLAKYRTSTELELQARSFEFSNILNPEFDSFRPQWLAAMPVPTEEEVKQRRGRFQQRKKKQLESSSDEDSDSDSDEEESSPSRKSKPAPAADSGNLLDLDDIFGGGGSQQAAAPAAAAAPQVDLLADIFGGAPSPAPAAAPMANGGGIDLLGMMGDAPAPQPPVSQGQVIQAFNKDGLVVSMNLEKEGTEVVAQVVYANNTANAMDRFVFQAAVPKYVTLKMGSPTGNTLPAFSSGAVTQTIRLTNSMAGSKPLLMKVKIAYTTNGQNVVEQVSVSNFPAGF